MLWSSKAFGSKLQKRHFLTCDQAIDLVALKQIPTEIATAPTQTGFD